VLKILDPFLLISITILLPVGATIVDANSEDIVPANGIVNVNLSVPAVTGVTSSDSVTPSGISVDPGAP
jgi:hypothetical protein